ncbi:MAG: DUF4189 domain-containing protein [Campylobacterales bacterium]|nr:DUF4189 domain-containing protein [Campylobacterales bacterium]
MGYYVSVGEESEIAAKNVALKGCKEIGNKNCQIAITFTKCGAYATSKKYSGAGAGATREIATNKALDECGDATCKVAVAECEE